VKARDEWPHTTAGSICDLGETVAIEVFDDDMEPGHVQLYYLRQGETMACAHCERRAASSQRRALIMGRPGRID
jgi:hypothetical protein